MRDATFLAFVWGAIFAVGSWAAVQYAVLWVSWQDPPTLADLIGTLIFAGLAIALLVPSLLVLWEIATGRFEELVEKARLESEE